MLAAATMWGYVRKLWPFGDRLIDPARQEIHLETTYRVINRPIRDSLLRIIDALEDGAELWELDHHELEELCEELADLVAQATDALAALRRRRRF